MLVAEKEDKASKIVQACVWLLTVYLQLFTVVRENHVRNQDFSMIYLDLENCISVMFLFQRQKATEVIYMLLQSFVVLPSYGQKKIVFSLMPPTLFTPNKYPCTLSLFIDLKGCFTSMLFLNS